MINRTEESQLRLYSDDSQILFAPMSSRLTKYRESIVYVTITVFILILTGDFSYSIFTTKPWHFYESKPFLTVFVTK